MLAITRVMNINYLLQRLVLHEIAEKKVMWNIREGLIRAEIIQSLDERTDP